ncbi:hypothetical protein ACKKBF_B41190 [Auxenochlorella protothecoides x Auxenochlorella symbiontica]
MRGVPPLLEPSEGPFTTVDIVAAQATVHCTYYNKPLTQATIPTEFLYDFLHGEGRMFRTSFHLKAHPANQDWLSIECFSDTTFQCLRLSRWAVDLVESLLATNPAFRNPSIVASARAAAQGRDKNISRSRKSNPWMLDPGAATSLKKSVQAWRSDFAVVQHDNGGLIELVELNDKHQHVLRDYAHGRPAWIDSMHGTNDVNRKAFLVVAMDSGNRVHNGSVALLRHERVEGIQ